MKKIQINGATYYDPNEHYTKDEIDDKFAEELQNVAFLSVDEITADANIYNDVPAIVTPQNYYTKGASDATFALKEDVGKPTDLKTEHKADLVAGINELCHLVKALNGTRFEVVTALPTVGENGVIYLVPDETTPNLYNQFIWNATDETFYSLGSTSINLDNYVKNTDYATGSDGGVVKIGNNIEMTAGKISVPIATESKVGVVKVGENIEVAEDGTISAKAGLKEVTYAEYEAEKGKPEFEDTYYAITDDYEVTPLIETVRAFFYPVGSVVMGNNLVDEATVKSIYGGNSWSKITGALYGVGDQITDLGMVNEESPNVKGNVLICRSNQPTYGAFGVQDLTSLVTKDVTNLTSGSWSTSFDLSSGQVNSDGTTYVPQSSSVYKDGGHVLAKGQATYAWVRTS